MRKNWEETRNRDKAGILKNNIKGKPEEDYKKGIKCCKDAKEDTTTKMHTEIKSGQEASKRRDRFCIYAILFKKIAIILYTYINPPQYIRKYLPSIPAVASK